MLLVCTRFPVIYYQTDVKSIAPFARLHPILRGLLSRDDIPFRMMLDRPAGGLRAVDREAVPRDQRGLRRHRRRDRARRHSGAWPLRSGLLKSKEGFYSNVPILGYVQRKVPILWVPYTLSKERFYSSVPFLCPL